MTEAQFRRRKPKDGGDYYRSETQLTTYDIEEELVSRVQSANAETLQRIYELLNPNELVVRDGNRWTIFRWAKNIKFLTTRNSDS